MTQLETDILEDETSTKSELEAVANEVITAGGTQDQTVTVIENPFLDGYLGFLLANHFHRKLEAKVLIDVLHVRADNRNNIQEPTHHKQVKIDRGFGMVYNFVSTDRGLILPALSQLPYEICFISKSDYRKFYDKLKEKKEVRDVLKSIYSLLAKKIPAFSLEGEKLILPEDYASIRN